MPPWPDSLVFRRVLGRELPTIARGEGVWLEDTEGRRYLDGSGGAVVVNIGHGRREVAEAMARQAETAAYVHGTQFTSGPLEEYARRLSAHAPGDCNRLYLVSGGSEANETAVKLARAFHLARGEPTRHKVVRRSIGYHGNTLATLALSAGEEIGWVAKQLGHANTEMVIRHYYKWVRNNTRQDGSAFDRVVEEAGL